MRVVINIKGDDNNSRRWVFENSASVNDAIAEVLLEYKLKVGDRLVVLNPAPLVNTISKEAI